MPALNPSSPNIAYCRPEFLDLLPRWNLIRDVLAGSATVKKKGDLYLPRPNPSDTSPENQVRYEQYKQRAVFYNATGRTLTGHVGQVMGTDPEITIPDVLTPVQENVDGSGISLVEQIGKLLSYGVAYGRAGLFVDYPRTPENLTIKQMAEQAIRPSISIVDPWDIINWRVRVIGGSIILALVVISEMYVVDDDGFEQKWEPMWRVLELTEENIFQMTEYISEKEGDKVSYKIRMTADGQPAVFIPKNAQGKPFNYIPFVFLGAVNNDPTPDLPPLYDLADLNIAHYRNSADYEESSYTCGQPTPFFSGLTDIWVKQVLNNQVQLGSRSAVLLPENGAAGLLQASPNSMPKEAMDSKERQMVTLGAKLVEQKTVQRTATEAGQDKASENSVLATIAKNVGKAYQQALGFCHEYLKGTADDVEVEVKLNTSFTATSMDAQSRAQLIAEWQAGAVTDKEMRGALTRAGIATLDIEEWKDAREQAVLNGNIVTPGMQLEATMKAKQDQAGAEDDSTPDAEA